MATRTVILKLIGDASSLRKALGDGAKHAEGFGARLDKVAGRARAVGRKLTIGIALPLAALAGSFLAAASTLEESQSKVQVVFGRSAQAMEKWAATASSALGQSRQQALEAAGTFGNLFVALKLPEAQAAKMSRRIVELASDLASFNNVSTDDALLALRSGLVGETEPLRRFGVNLNEATLRTKALELGLIKNVKQGLTPAQKAQAAYAIILEQTRKAQGDFARTSDGVANRTRIVRAQFADAAATLGTQLLPVAKQVLGWASEMLQKFGRLSPETQRFVLIAAGAAIALGPTVSVVGNLARAVTGLGKALTFLSAHPLIAVATAIGLLAAGLFLLRGRTDLAASSIRSFNTSLARSKQLTEEIKQSELDRTGAVLQLKAATFEEARTAKELARLRKEGKKGTDEFTQAELAHEQAILGVTLAQTGLGRVEDELSKKRAEDAKQATFRRQKLSETIEDVGKLTGAMKFGTVSSELLRSEIAAIAEQMKITRTPLREVLDELDKFKNIPPKVRTEIEAILRAELATTVTIKKLVIERIAGPGGSTIGGATAFHHGGTVPGPSSREVVAVLRGGEEVLTREQAGHSVVINLGGITIHSSAQDGRRLARELLPEISRLLGERAALIARTA